MLTSYGQLPNLLYFDPVGVIVDTPRVNKVESENLLTRSQPLLSAKCEELSPISKEPNQNGTQLGAVLSAGEEEILKLQTDD